jgi:hypothetical protein
MPSLSIEPVWRGLDPISLFHAVTLSASGAG